MNTSALSIGSLFLIASCVLYSWYFCQRQANHRDRSPAFSAFGTRVLCVSILFCLVSTGILLLATISPWALLTLPIFFFILPLALIPILRHAQLVPHQDPQQIIVRAINPDLND